MSADDRAEARTLVQHAEAAEQAVRALNHRTRPAVGELADPAETAGMIAALAVLAGMLPQLLDQLRCWLLDEHHAGRLRVDRCTPTLMPGPGRRCRPPPPPWPTPPSAPDGPGTRSTPRTSTPPTSPSPSPATTPSGASDDHGEEHRRRTGARAVEQP